MYLLDDSGLKRKAKNGKWVETLKVEDYAHYLIQAVESGEDISKIDWTTLPVGLGDTLSYISENKPAEMAQAEKAAIFRLKSALDIAVKEYTQGNTSKAAVVQALAKSYELALKGAANNENIQLIVERGEEEEICSTIPDRKYKWSREQMGVWAELLEVSPEQLI